MNRSLAAEFLLLAALWGLSFLFTRMGATEFGPWATAGLRVLVASLCLAPVLWWSGAWPDFKRKAGPILFVGLLNSGIPFALYAYAVMSITTGLSAILNATVPLFGALVAWVWLGDKPQRWRAVGLAIGFVGVGLLSWNKASFKPGGTGWAVVACLAATFCYGVAASFTKKHLMGIQPMATATGSQWGASLGLAVPTLWFWPDHTPSATAWVAVGALGLFCTAVAYILYFRLIERAGPSKTLTVTFLIPVFALLYGALFLGESVTTAMLLGGLVIVAGVALATGLVDPGRHHQR
ncbi:MAG: hypothetical protein RJA09_2296 [Pseudomonadota bacterium]